ncbi:MAG: hypothetical protein JWQ64_370, partial [Subtercola sp.]|nr:hypothetical protein [Subtercola sp.]
MSRRLVNRRLVNGRGLRVRAGASLLRGNQLLSAPGDLTQDRIANDGDGLEVSTGRP